MRYLLFIIVPMLLYCSNPKSAGKKAEILQGTEIGIESIKDNGDGTLDIAIYMYTTLPVAGFQADLLPKEYFKIESILGGIGLLLYAILRKDPVIITGQIFGIFIYTRNLILIYKKKKNE